ncbi:hypothetical protein SEA_MISCHIEF19_48 [Streptomyces phage Mischief19]|nr:hypothetical protein SEA_MISCHIEF19_48 [Streptomyces phage Mischief19]
MNANARTARRIVKARRDANKAHAKGLHTLKSHCLKAGLADDLAGSVAGALRGKAKTLGVTGCSAYMLRKANGELRPVRGAKRYDALSFAVLAAAYKPRAPRLVEARELLLASV